MGLDDLVWSEEPVLDSQEYLGIHKIPRPATKVETPPDHELMELNIQEDIPDLTDVPEEVISDFDAWVQSLLDYPW